MMTESPRLLTTRAVAVGILVLLLGLVMPLAPNGTVAALLLLGLATLSVSTIRQVTTSLPIELGIGLVVLAAWTVASAYWSPLADPGKALRTVALGVPGLVLFAWLGDNAPRSRTLRRALLVALTVAAAIFLFEGLSGAALMRALRGEDADTAANNLERVGRGVVLFSILLWPTAIALGRKRLAIGGLFFVGGAFAIVLLPMNAATVGLLLGTVMFVAVRIAPRAALTVLAIAFCLYAAFAPWISRDIVTIPALIDRHIELPTPWAHRIGIWNFAAGEAADAAPLGAGFDAARAIGAQGDVIESLRPQFGYAPAALPLHPHNAVLQVWLELGVVGVIGLALVFVGLLRGLWRSGLTPWGRAAAAAAVVTALPPFVVNFGIWQAWWLATLWLAAAIAAGLLTQGDPHEA
jgi:O-antigen ligase